MKKEEIKKQLEEIKSLLRKGEDKPLNFNQAAQYLGFSHSYLYRLTSRKIIPCHRPTGKVLFFSKNELEEWIFESGRCERGNVKGEKQEARGEEEEEDEEDEEAEKQ